MKTCTRCKTEKSVEEFEPHGKYAGGRRSWCRNCTKAYRAEWVSRNRHKTKANKDKYAASSKGKRTKFAFLLKSRYGMSIEDFAWMIHEQKFLCGACLFALDFFAKWDVHVDHCHTTGKIRGVLCHACNTSLGKFGEDSMRISNLAIYAERHAG